MNIKLNNNVYPIPDSVLAGPTADFVAHLGTIEGDGMKVVVGGVGYGVDATKVASALGELETVLGSLSGGSTPNAPSEERLEGDGQEYYTLAPTALSFRSTAPLNELQEVQINGVTVDPSNYTLEEGSTIVTFPIDYLKTLDVGSYEVTVASDSKAVKGDFTVAAPELNEYGFYYNQPYVGYVAPLDSTIAFFVREGGTFDSIEVRTGGVETGTYEISGNSIVSTNSLGTLHSTISDDGTEIYCTEIATTFKLGNESVVSDDDYIYIYNEDLGGYEVTAINKTKAEYGAIKTGINGIDTVAFGYSAFEDCTSLMSIEIPTSVTTIDSSAFQDCTSLTSITIPVSVVSIGRQMLWECSNLTSITYTGTTAQWNAIIKGENWNFNVPATYVQCSDGTVAL